MEEQKWPKAMFEAIALLQLSSCILDSVNSHMTVGFKPCHHMTSVSYYTEEGIRGQF